MAYELAFDLHGIGNEEEILKLSYATFVEELQLQEILKVSMIASEKELEGAACEVIKKPECAAECTNSQGSGVHEPPSINRQDLATWRAERPGCVEQQRINWDDKARERFEGRKLVRDHFKGRKPMERYNMFGGRRMRDFPQTNSRQFSSNAFHANTSSRGKGGHLAGTGNTGDPKWKSDSRGRNRAHEKGLDLEHANLLKGSKDYNINAVHEDDYVSLDDEDDFDSDDSQKSHESRKKRTWFKEFFERLDALSIEEIDETLWHCPACQGGPGAVKWYRSISDLIAHSEKIGSRRVKLHRELAELLEGELSIKGTSISPADPMFGAWKGLNEDAKDHEIVWPPMVVIMNTMTSNFKDGKIVGMGSKELLGHFSLYQALKAQHSYGPQGHRGLSLLIFESSAVGYLEAERLHNNFLEQRLGRSAWNSCTDEVLTGGERQLYGFMAVKEDLDIFNQHCQGKEKIKYELKSYREAVLDEIKTMKEESQQVIWFKDRLEEERKRVKTFEASVNNLSRNLQQKMKDIHIFEKRVKSLHEENKEEMDSQEVFYKDQIKILEAKVKELDEKLKESDAASHLNTGEPAAAMADLMEKYTCTPYQYNNSKEKYTCTPYQYNNSKNNISIDED